MGPFEALAKLFEAAGKIANVAATSVDVVDKSIIRTASQIDRGFDALDLVTEGMVEDLQTDQLVAKAERTIKRAKAEAKVSEMLKAIEATK